ncbi:MAG TPA: ArsA family ATPase [Thermoanaerobaculia bacterium]|nr:ArsA family ATPase [Thermoanaerobaculia bacterium]
MSLLDALSRRKLLVVTGKGGVGKTAVSAVLGRKLSQLGRRVLVVEVDPRENLYQMFGIQPSGGEIISAGPNLWIQNLKPRQVLDAVVRERLKLELLTKRVLSSTIYQHFAEGAPGLTEIAILGHAWRILHGIETGAPQIDLIVLDAPATGHGVRLLASPLLVSEVIKNGPFAEMGGELARLISDPERCGIVAVTQAEEMPVQEVLELREALRQQVSRDPEALVVNGLYPPAPAPGEVRDNELVSLWRKRRLLNDRELARLREAWKGPRIELPQLPLDRGPELIATLQHCLEQGVEKGADAWT